MKPIGILMIEHRLIEKVLTLVSKEIEHIDQRLAADASFLKSVIDFIQTYADRIHHGKEEDILFAQLKTKAMNAHDTAVMKELDEEHKDSRRTVAELIQAADGYAKGDRAQLDVIKEKLTFITGFYPVHIAKEDKDFFLSTQRYFTPDELDNMLEEFYAFDRPMDKEKYNKLYETLKESVKQ